MHLDRARVEEIYDIDGKRSYLEGLSETTTYCRIYISRYREHQVRETKF